MKFLLGMIAKISTGINTDGMVNYNHSKTKKTKDNVPDAILLSTNLIKINKNVDAFLVISSAIKSRNSFNNKVEKKNIHISLNFHKDDILTNEKILEIGKDYMDQMGYGDQPYAVYRHFDKEHPHIHIVCSQIDINGMKINDSNLFYRSVALSRKLEEKYNITKPIGKKSAYSKYSNIQIKVHEHLDNGKHSLSAILNTVLIDVMKNKPSSEEQFDKLLEQYQVKRNITFDNEEKPTGHSFGLLPDDYFENEKNKWSKNSKGIPGSDLDLSFSYNSIMDQIAFNLKEKKELQSNIMGRVYSIINPIIEVHTKNNKKEKLSDFILKLQKKGIQLEVKRAQTGDNLNMIYGLVFKDIKTGHSYSATDIKLKTKDFLKAIEDDLKDKKEQQVNSKVENILNKREENDLSEVKNEDNATNAMGDFLQILAGALQGGAGQNESLPRKKRRRRKR